MQKKSKIFVAGGTGLVGSAIIRKLKEKGYTNITSTYHNRKPQDNDTQWHKIDLTDSIEVENFFEEQKPEFVFLAAAKVGGIMANNIYRADFIYENLQIQNNIIYNAYKYKTKKLLFLGSTCIYPKNCPQPIKEEYLLTGELEYTNEPYAIAKIAGIKMCESFNLQYGTNFLSVMPTNLYGPHDNFDLETSHVLPALLRKMYLGKCLEEGNFEAIRKDLDKNPIEGIDGNVSKEEILNILDKYGISLKDNGVQIEIWGSGKPKREFMYSNDMADACVYIMEKINFTDIIKEQLSINTSCDVTCYTTNEIRNTHINIGTGKDISIKELAYLIKEIVGLKGDLYFNTKKPDGTMRKVTDVTKLHNLGWRHKTELEVGIGKVYKWYVNIFNN
ncbi:GDP-L-fucose synthase family protein [Nitratiruptor tergarcus]|uniref:GDP-L-fucose synthase n=1 Tax=Nitratiruptor tergarcus DSM 16512 TaxID=1069081 RepID=A0A1W1WT83_9BACT|nr:GDP-L-fucose synthase [Nitratiruptor tergarcus]SMC09497.1 GDP-L-fucose synthase [Nitratiruptor tergarcus DSM 16512]